MRRYSIGKGDLISIGKGALIAGAGAVLAYIAHTLSLLEVDPDTAVYVAVASILVNFLRKLLDGAVE